MDNDLISHSGLGIGYANPDVFNVPEYAKGWNDAVKIIKEAPTVDAVEVVRCGECEKRNKSADLTDSIYCRWLKCQMRKNDFCSYGERRTK